MFERNEKLSKARGKLLDLFATKSRGELIKHEEIEKIVGMRRGDTRYYALVRQAGLKHQEAKGVSVISEPSLGYLMATHEQQFGLLGKRIKYAKRHVRKGTSSVDALPDEELTDHQRRLKGACVENGNSSARALQRDAALEAYLMRRKPGEPLKITLMKDDAESA